MLILLTNLPLSQYAYSDETRYIRDTLFVPLRSGQSYKYRIIHKGLVSGTALTLLEQSDDESYSKVRTEQGIEGWLETQYLSEEPSARSRVNSLALKNEKMTSENTALKQKINALTEVNNEQKNALKALDQQYQILNKELTDIKAISANALTLNDNNTELLQQNQVLQNQADILTTDNQRLKDQLDNDNFLNGAFAVLIGVFITLLVPRLWPSKSSEWA